MSTLAEILRQLPPEAQVPVGWVLGRLDESQSEGRDDLLTLKDVAEIVGRAPGTIRAWCNSGQIDGAFRLNGREWRIPESVLDDYLDGQADDPGSRKQSAEAVDLGDWRDFVDEGAA